jgi:hypothetical protein
MSYLDTYTGTVPILSNAVAVDGNGAVVIAGVLIENPLTTTISIRISP